MCVCVFCCGVHMCVCMYECVIVWYSCGTFNAITRQRIMYSNGKMIGSDYAAGLLLINTPLQIGYFGSKLMEYGVDELQFYSRKLTVNEIPSIYNNTYCNIDGLQFYYRFSNTNDNRTYVRDYSPYNRTLQLVGIAPLWITNHTHPTINAPAAQYDCVCSARWSGVNCTIDRKSVV